jgi:hypothetical protein
MGKRPCGSVPFAAEATWEGFSSQKTDFQTNPRLPVNRGFFLLNQKRRPGKGG